MRELPRYQKFFVCGRNNQAGLNMVWAETDEGVQGKYRAEEKHCGYKGILHGGIISALIDECIGWAVSQKEEKMHVTGELSISYTAPVPIDKELNIKGYFSKEQVGNKKYRNGHGHIVDNQGVVYATGKGIFFPILAEHEQGIINILENPMDIEKKVTFEDLWS